MENLDKSHFIVLLETSLTLRLLSPEQKTLDAAYEDYIDLLHGLLFNPVNRPSTCCTNLPASNPA